MPQDLARHLPFSQRTGMSPIPPQLKIDEGSAEFRRLCGYFIDLELKRISEVNYVRSGVRTEIRGRKFRPEYFRFASDFHVRFLQLNFNSFRNLLSEVADPIHKILESESISNIFDMVEFILRHKLISSECKSDLIDAFEQSRMAYRVFDRDVVVAIGSDAQAQAVERGILDAEACRDLAAKRHLISAGVALRHGDWPGSIRESIHAVESVALRLAPEAGTLGAALAVVERQGNLHGGLKSAFAKLYGFTSDSEGVRHALVFGNEASVDETDALFMIGACASFVSYLLARTRIESE